MLLNVGTLFQRSRNPPRDCQVLPVMNHKRMRTIDASICIYLFESASNSGPQCEAASPPVLAIQVSSTPFQNLLSRRRCQVISSLLWWFSGASIPPPATFPDDALHSCIECITCITSCQHQVIASHGLKRNNQFQINDAAYA